MKKRRKATPEQVASINRSLALRCAPHRVELDEHRRLRTVRIQSAISEDRGALVITADAICYIDIGAGPATGIFEW